MFPDASGADVINIIDKEEVASGRAGP